MSQVTINNLVSKVLIINKIWDDEKKVKIQFLSKLLISDKYSLWISLFAQITHDSSPPPPQPRKMIYFIINAPFNLYGLLIKSLEIVVNLRD